MDADCLEKDWAVDCYGHWDCSADGQCYEACGEPCGNGICEEQEGENMNTCYDDCQDVPPLCQTDMDCLGQPWYINCLGHWDCSSNGQCIATCGEPCGDGECDPYAGEERYNCNDCYDEPSCTSDSDCGVQNCYTVEDGYCMQEYPYCGNGECHSKAEKFSDSECMPNSGRCVPRQTTCDSVGGFCTDGIQGCPAGSHRDSTATCEYSECAGACDCCIPDEEVGCEELGGTCAWFIQDCEYGYYDSQESMGCQLGVLQHCCLPMYFK